MAAVCRTLPAPGRERPLMTQWGYAGVCAGETPGVPPRRHTGPQAQIPEFCLARVMGSAAKKLLIYESLR